MLFVVIVVDDDDEDVYKRSSVAFAEKRAASALHHPGIFGRFASREIPAAAINVSTLAYAPTHSGRRQRVRAPAAVGLSRKHCCVEVQVWRTGPLRFGKAPGS